jgi:hypothetical protein
MSLTGARMRSSSAFSSGSRSLDRDAALGDDDADRLAR